MLECDGGGQNMFQRFTDKARRTVVLAQEEARALRHDHIGTQHLLLGLLRESAGVAATALTSLGVSLAAARARVADARPAEPPPSDRTPTEGHIPFTPEAKRTLELALRESLQLGHDYIGTEHILLGLIREPACRAAAILSELGADRAAITQRVLELRPAGPPRPRPARTEPRSLAEIRVKVESVLARLTAVEKFTGMTPELANIDAELGRLRREKEEAIDAQDFRLAEALSDAETDLLVDRERRASEWLQRPSLAAEVAQLRSEVERLRVVLREHGLDLDEAS
jgi:ATP-dependent Clp protease ATP-binding subunit ClpA